MRFLLVDRVTELESGKRAVGIKNVTLSEDFFAFHFPSRPIMPGALITECLVQLADWVLRESSDFQCIGMPSAFDSLKFYRLVTPGDQLKLEVEVNGQQDNHFLIRGEARCQEEIVAVGRFTMVRRSAREFEAAEDSRRLFNVIRGISGPLEQ